MNELKDLREYTGESGGTHGLDDVSKGIVTLHRQLLKSKIVYSEWGIYPHCRYHGAMLKVSADGIWRCGITDAFQRYHPKNPPEMAIAHGAYYDNRTP